MTTLFYLNFLLNFSTILQYWEQPANFAKLFRITYQRGLEFPHAVHFSLHSKFKESWICTEHWASLSWSVTKIERWEMWHAVLSVWGLNGCLTGKLFSLIRWKSISEQDKFWSTKVLNWITLSLTQNLYTQSDSILGNVVFKIFHLQLQKLTWKLGPRPYNFISHWENSVFENLLTPNFRSYNICVTS